MKKKKENYILLVVNLVVIATLYVLYVFDFFNSNIDKPIIVYIVLGIISLIYSKKPFIFILFGVEAFLILIYFINISYPEIVDKYFNWLFF